MSKLSLSDNFLEIMVKLAEGNPGAAAVLSELFRNTTKIDPQAGLGELHYLLFLDDMEIYGDRIWILYKYLCGSNLVKMIAVLRGYQLGIVPKSTIKADIEKVRNHTGEELLMDVDNVVVKVQQELPEFSKVGE